jgi:hypothetical protein
VTLKHGGRLGAPRLHWALIALGAGLRTLQYLADRSLWYDELLLALNLRERTLGGLLGELSYNQGAAYGFLALEKLATQLLGESELALRLFPFLCGLLALLLFYALGRRTLSGPALTVALALFAVARPLIYYSSEAKQYASDVALTLLIALLALRLLRDDARPWPLALLLALAGASGIWLSLPLIFVLLGIGLLLLVQARRGANRRVLAQALVLGLSWGGSFAASYLLVLRPLGTNAKLISYWGAAFAPFPPASLADLTWFVKTFLGLFVFPVGLGLSGVGAFPGLGAFSALAGAARLWAERRMELGLLLLPIPFALAASALQRYPFVDRLVLFLVPALLLLIGAGAGWLIEQTRAQSRLVGTALVGLLLLYPTLSAGYRLLNPRTPEDVEPVLQQIAQRRRPQDVIYAYHNAQFALRYYGEAYGLDAMGTIIGAPPATSVAWAEAEAARLHDLDRVWLLFAHYAELDQRLLLEELDTRGSRLDMVAGDGVAAYLYDLQRP